MAGGYRMSLQRPHMQEISLQNVKRNLRSGFLLFDVSDHTMHSYSISIHSELVHCVVYFPSLSRS